MKDNEWAGVGNHLEFKHRGYDPRICRFMSVDPLAKQYPWNGAYNFAEDRVIDGLDLEGLEYATFNIYVDLHSGNVTQIKTTTDYELKNKNSTGPGIQYNYIDNSTGKPFRTTSTANMYGIYQGPLNPELPEVGGKYTDTHDDYRLAPIDETDGIAKRHDLRYDKKQIRGLGGVLSSKSSEANKEYIKGADEIIAKQKNREKDNVTGKPVTKEAADAAKFGKKSFQSAEDIKEGKSVEQHVEKSKYLPPQ
jgi:hypothetical protein